jgi:hypothetical protein
MARWSTHLMDIYRASLKREFQDDKTMHASPTWFQRILHCEHYVTAMQNNIELETGGSCILRELIQAQTGDEEAAISHMMQKTY